MEQQVYQTNVLPTFSTLPVDSRVVPIPPSQTPPALIPHPPSKPPQTVYERSMGTRIRCAIFAGILFFVFSLPATYRLSHQIWLLFSSVPLISKTSMVPMMVQHPNGYQVQQMVERPGSISMRAMALHAGAVAFVMYMLLSRHA